MFNFFKKKVFFIKLNDNKEQIPIFISKTNFIPNNDELVIFDDIQYRVINVVHEFKGYKHKIWVLLEII